MSRKNYRTIGRTVCALSVLVGVTAYAAERAPEPRAIRRGDNPRVPRTQEGPLQTQPAVFPESFRTIDGSENNSRHPDWGSAGVELLRLTTVDYADGVGEPAGQGRRSAREISNVCMAQETPTLNATGASDFLWQWGQFLDHDIDETLVLEPPEPFDIPVPFGDPFFDPFGTGNRVIRMNRSFYNIVDGSRMQVNGITAYIDASNVYGSEEERARELRALDGTGRLKTSEGNLLPFNENGLPNAPSTEAFFFLAGDFRANEQVALTAMHTLFVREHNTQADQIRASLPDLSGYEIFERARAIVAAEMQAITYNEFLPVLLGKDALTPYEGYRHEVNAGIANVFATAAFRVGHTMLSTELLRLNETGEPISEGNLSLSDAFFNPLEILDVGIEPYLRGLASQKCQEVDNEVIDDVRNFLFGAPGSGGFDLASLNIQRGRDHGLPGYNQVRQDYGLPAATTFADINPDPDVQANLAAVYDSPENMDVWVGGLAEPHVTGAMVGKTFHTILKDQFERLRDGDRYWYQSYLPKGLVDSIEQQTLSSVIRRNTEIGGELPSNVFRVGDAETNPDDPRMILSISESAGHFTITFQSSAQRVYTLWRCVSLSEGLWEKVDGQAEIRGSGGIDSLTDFAPAADGCFYRVEVSFP